MRGPTLKTLFSIAICLSITSCLGIWDDGGLFGLPPSQVSSPGHQRVAKEDVELTVLTYNVANLGHGGNRIDSIARFISLLGADFVGLNELDSCNSRHGNYQLKDLAAKLGGWSYHFASAFAFAGGGYGNGALSPNPLLDARTVNIPRGSGHEPRSIAIIETEDAVFGSVHLDYGPPGDPSYEQAIFLNDWFKAHYSGYGKPVILTGDFNTDPGTPTQEEMEKCWTRLSEPALSWPTVNPEMCLDYVFSFKDAVPATAVETSRPVGIINLDINSDHYPVRVKLRFSRNKTNFGLCVTKD